MKKILLAVLALTFCFSAVAFAAELTPGMRTTIKQVQATNLFTTLDGERVKLIGIKIPSNKKITKESLNFVKQEAVGKPIIIEPAGVDNSGRTLARVFVGNQSMQDMLLVRGYAILDETSAGVSANAWRKTESDAKARSAGWWGEPQPAPKSAKSGKGKRK